MIKFMENNLKDILHGFIFGFVLILGVAYIILTIYP